MDLRSSRFRASGRLLLVLALCGLAGAATAQDVCTIGNPAEPAGTPAPDIFQGNETYAYSVFPPAQCSCGEGGFTPETASHLLYFDAAQVPATFEVTAQLLAAVYDPTLACYLPGPVICAGLPTPVTVSLAGYFQVDALFDSCPVQPFNEHYFLALKYTGGAPGYLATDGAPLECTEFVDRGNGWEDMFLFPGKTGGGKSIVFGDIVCGAYSVPDEAQPWGAIKSLYR